MHYREWRLVQMGLSLHDIDETPGVRLDWLLAIDGAVAKAQDDLTPKG